MVRLTALCPSCKTKISVEGKSGEQKKITCNKCKEKRIVLFGETDLEELAFYPLEEPFSYASIVKDINSLEKYYLVIEPPLKEDEIEFLGFVYKQLMESLDVRFDQVKDKATEFILLQVDRILKSYQVEISEDFRKRLMYYTIQRFLRYGKIDPLMRDSKIEDISCDGAGVPVYVFHRDYGSLASNIIFKNEEELSSFVVLLAQKCGKHISIANPMLDATLPDGSRVQMTLSSEITTRGSTFTIRKFRENPFSPVDIINFHTMSPEMVAYFWMAVEYGVNALISGGTASGKTSTLNAIALFIPREAKIVSIEETREINLPHPNWIPGVARSGFGDVVDGKLAGEIDMYDLMKAALRQRPEYIIVGEIRGREAYVLFQAMATGHVTYSTIHADSTRALINRLEGKPINIPRSMMHSLDLVILQGLYKEEGRNIRRCKQIVELVDIDPQTNEVLTNTVFKWDPGEDEFIYSGKSYILDSLRIKLDMTAEEMKKELARRVEILKWMQKKNLREFKDVARIVDTYRENPAQLLKEIKEDVPVKEILEEHSFEEKIDKMAVSNKNHDVREKLHEITLFLSRYKPGKNKRRGK